MAKTSPRTKITLNSDEPTMLTFKQLHDWVIWQIPQSVGNGLRGAVKPSSVTQQWYPAIVDVKKEKVQVYGHLDELFETPESASKYLTKNN